MVKKQEPDIPVTQCSGNVFADLGFAEPEEELTKAELASHIRQVIQRRRLTQVAAAALMGIDQPKVSPVLRAQPSCKDNRNTWNNGPWSSFIEGGHC